MFIYKDCIELYKKSAPREQGHSIDYSASFSKYANVSSSSTTGVSTFVVTGLESDKEIARKQKRKLQYFSNIYVVSDTKHPENEGKVFLFRYGKKIFDKITAAMSPEFEDEKAINPFDFWEGANFKLKIRKVDGYWNYDKSEFEAPSALFDNDGQIEDVWKKAYALSEFSAPTNFKSYEELKTRLDTVLSGTTTVGNVMETISKDPEPEIAPTVNTKPVELTLDHPIAEVEEDDTMSYFEKLAKEQVWSSCSEAKGLTGI